MEMQKILFLCALSAFCLMAMVTFAEDDHIYLECKDHPRGPWCYQEAVEQHNQPELCENILKYWPKADGVHGWCYYQLAMKNKDCSLCDRIHAADIKKMCRLDVCN
ncbi:hypothetical protein DSCW_40530 [Desulfosarcina widdelii]|uniref:Lipoprotein n=2 Tax=Desulfosarcina widdelii TaxID=947919 RepID=A0A5K7Z4F5_9BACT|nr:hypothetical protein DSCW_40530 [Desulfosarcina widdelii]